jgi:hypothetical protein
MPARIPALDAAAEDPEPWPVGVDGARLVNVAVSDPDHPDLAVTFEFGMVPAQAMSVVRFHLESRPGYSVTSLRDLPMSRWERAARAAAESRIVTNGPIGQHVDPDALADELVDARFPELTDAKGGNPLRRRNGLVHLAKMFQEYKQAEQSGVQNPAQALANAHSVTTATVRGWLHRARKEGLAPESSHPNAGGRA